MTRSRLVNTILVIWAALFVLSFVLPLVLEPTGDGFTRGLNRVGAFIACQGFAMAIALATWLSGFGFSREESRSRWLSRVPAIIHLVMIGLVIGLILIIRFAGSAIEVSVPAGPATAPAKEAAPAAEPLPELPPAPAPEPQADIRQFNGIFRGGFESSHFYTMEGEGPWCLEASEIDLERINASYTDGPGRAGSVTVALIVNGSLEETGGELDYLGIDRYRLQVESIEGIRALSEQEFDLVLATIRPR